MTDKFMTFSLKGEEKPHAVYAPSQAKVWMNCTAAVPVVQELKAAGEYRDSAGRSAKAGTIMHAMAEKCLREALDPVTLAEDGWTIGDPEEGILLSPEDWSRHVVPYVRHVRALREEAAFWGEPLMGIEPVVQILGDDCFGSVDAWACVAGSVLHVVDLKTGGGLVSPVENPQLMLYAWGILNDLLPGHQVQEVVLTISQVAAEETISSWRTAPEDIAVMAGKALAAIEASKSGGEFKTGAQCTHCPAKKHGRCPKATEALMEMFEEPTPVAPVRDLLPEKLSGEQLSALLPKIPAIKAILKFLEEEAVRRLANGLEDAPADYKLVRGTSRRRWRTDIPQAELVQALIDKGIEPWQKKMTTLTEVETLHGKGSIDDLLEKPEPAPRLVPCTAKGVAWSPTDAALAAFDAEDDSDD